jgi:hypothetical protein
MAKDKKEKLNYKKKGFPLGIFILLFIIESLLAAGGMGLYFIHTGRKRIADIERYTRSYSIAMMEATGDVAALCQRTKQYASIKNLFREKLREDTVNQAFFVLNDGKIIVHSKKEIQEELEGNIANDEFSYNLDQILAPSRKMSTEVFFSSYNVMTARVPFNRDERELIARYLYPEVASTGWLVSKAVYDGKKPTGTVNFIIDKSGIYGFIRSHMEESLRYLRYCMAGAALISFMISLIIWLRYRSIQKKALSGRIFIDHERPLPQWENMGPDSFITIDISGRETPAAPSVEPELMPRSGDRDYADVIELRELKSFSSSGKGRILQPGDLHTIRDAIPVTRKTN